MNMEPMEIAWKSVAILVSCAAALMDVKIRKVPNALTMPAAAAGLILFYLRGGTGGVWDGCLGIFFALAILILPFAARLIGAGDVKLVMALGAIMGWRMMLRSFLFSCVFGGLLALFVLGIKGKLGRKWFSGFSMRFKSYILTKDMGSLKPETKEDIIFMPYGVAIALGTLSGILTEGLVRW